MNKIFQIGEFCFSLSCPEEVLPPSHFMIFEKTDGEPEYTYHMFLKDKLPIPDGKIIVERSDIKVFQSGDREHRLLGVKGQSGYYACYQETSEDSADIYLDINAIQDLNIDPVFCSLFALERRMIQKSALILHCAYIEYNGKAILFSAPSETGKTTQAELWGKYVGSSIVNGDRALIKKNDFYWTASGWPVCGSSDVCTNKTMPILAIVMLSQSEQNEIVRLKPKEAFMQLYGQLTINRWNLEHGIKGINVAEQIVQEIPIFHLGCTISEEAVTVLKTVLQK